MRQFPHCPELWDLNKNKQINWILCISRLGFEMLEVMISSSFPSKPTGKNLFKNEI